MPRILVVEDEEETVELYRIVLNKLGYSNVDFATDGNKAVERYHNIDKDEFPEIVLMDYRMPNKDGLQAAKEILEIDPNAVIVFVSEYPEVCDEAVQLGALMFSGKPLNKTLMQEMINTALHARSLRTSSS